MTKLRAPISFELALTRIAGMIGWPDVAKIVGRAERTVRKWSDHDVEVGVRIDAALKLDLAWRQAGNDSAPMMEVYQLRLKADTEMAMDGARLAEITADAAKEGGEALAAMIAATRPDATDAERLIARREVEQAIGVFTASLPMLGPAGGQSGSDTGPGGPS